MFLMLPTEIPFFVICERNVLYCGSQCTEMVFFGRRRHTATAAALNNGVCVCVCALCVCICVLFRSVCQAVIAAFLECYLNSVS